MAYNPFNIFRRNQKALFAVLTVFVMVVFTLSSGVAGGDFFETFTRWLGAKSGSKEAVCKIDGHTVTTGELEGGPRSLQYRRMIANKFMTLAAQETTRALEQYISGQQSRLSEAGKETAMQAFQVVNMLRSPQFAPLIVEQLPAMADRLNQQISSQALKGEDREVAQAAQSMYLLLHRLSIGGNGHYFINAPARTRRDQIEFLLWEKKAEQLGIRFTKDDVKRMLQSEFSGYFRSDVDVRKAMQDTQGFTMDVCLDALAAEFRVRAAQSAVLGHGSRYGGAPVFTTPYEAFEFYREQRSPATYEVIAVPAAAFLDKVPGEPTDAEINELFKKYADDEPNPRTETPGFKDPRKIAIAWFGITGDEPYYKKLAEEQIKVGEVMAKASGALTVPLPGTTGSWATAALAPLTLKEPAVAAAYNTYEREFNELHRRFNYERSALTPRSPFSSLTTDDPMLPTSVVRPGVLASTLGAFVGQSAGLGNPGAAVTLSMTTPLAYEIRDRITTGLPLVLGAIPGPALLPTAVGGAALYTTRQPKPLPIEALRPELLKSTIDKRAKALAYGAPADSFSFDTPKAAEKGDIARFIEELQKLSENDRPKDKAAVEKYINEFLAARGITNRGASTAPRDEWSIEDDPTLAPLVQAQKESLLLARGAHGATDPYIPFGRSFFWKPDPRTGRAVQTTGLYLAEPYPPRDRSSGIGARVHYVYWRTEDIAAKKTLNLQTAKTSGVVRDAWKRMKARELAQAKANAMAEKIRQIPTTDPTLLQPQLWDLRAELQKDIKDKKAEKRASLFTIRGVCPLVIGPGGQFGQGGQLMRYGLQESEDIPYPTAEMETALLENRDKGPKTVLVLPDAPKDTYYVATLLRRDLKTPSEFKIDVYSQFGTGRNILYLHQAEVARNARQSVVELLKKEFEYEETEDQKKKLDENVKTGGRGDF